jgi:hypothetical protein
MIAFRNFANAPKNGVHRSHISLLTIWQFSGLIVTTTTTATAASSTTDGALLLPSLVRKIRIFFSWIFTNFVMQNHAFFKKTAQVLTQVFFNTLS